MTRLVRSALVDVLRGRVLSYLGGDSDPAMDHFALVVSELCAADRGAWAYAAFEAVGGREPHALSELVIAGGERVHVVQRLPWDPGRAVLTIGDWHMSIGVVVAASRERLHSLERQP